MQRKKKPAPFKALLTRHAEKIALGIACGLLTTYVLLGIVRNGESAEIRRFREKLDDVRIELGKTHEEPPKLKPHYPLTLESWNTVSNATPANDWSGTLAPTLIRNPIPSPINPHPEKKSPSSPGSPSIPPGPPLRESP